MSDPQAALSRAQDVLQDVLDEARAIAGNPNAGAKPRAVAEAVLEASPLVDEALEGWPEEPDEGPPDVEPPEPEPIPPEPIPPEPIQHDEPPMYVPALAGLLPADLASQADVQDFLQNGDADEWVGVVRPGVTIDGLPSGTRGGTQMRPKVLRADRGDDRDFAGRATLKNARHKVPWLWLDGFVLPAKSSGASLTVAADDTFTTDCWFKVGDMQGQTGIANDGRAYRTRIGRCRFDSNQRSGDAGDVVQGFSKSRDTNPDYWDVYLCDLQTTTKPGQIDKQNKGGMALYAEPGIDSGDQDALSPSDPMEDYSQHNSVWRRCRVRTTTKFGWYAKHIPDLVLSDLAFADAEGNVLGFSHVVAFRGGSSRGGRIMRVRAECSTFHPGDESSSKQAFTLQSWFHEVGWCEAVGGAILVYCYCPHVEGGKPVYGAGNKPLQAAHYARLWRNKGLLVLGATREDGDGGINPKGPIEGVLIEAHRGDIVDDAGKRVEYDPGTGRITSSHKWIRTEQTCDVPESPTGGDHCLIREACDKPEHPPFSLGRDAVGPGAAGCVPWDGRGVWPTVEGLVPGA